MTAEAPVVASPQHRGRDRAHTAAPKRPPRDRRLLQRLSRSEAVRAWNRERIGLVFELRCECGRPMCADTVPVAAETHRGSADRFVVAPAHFGGGMVVRAADRFFVVDSGGLPLRQARRSLR